MPGGAAEMESFRNGNEVPEVAEFDVFIHIYRVSIMINKILDI
jgi:hypothetical protein